MLMLIEKCSTYCCCACCRFVEIKFINFLGCFLCCYYYFVFFFCAALSCGVVCKMHNNIAQNTRNLITENKIKLLEWMKREVQVDLKMVLWRFLQLTERRNWHSTIVLSSFRCLMMSDQSFEDLRASLLKIDCYYYEIILEDEWGQVKVRNEIWNATSLNLYQQHINF